MKPDYILETPQVEKHQEESFLPSPIKTSKNQRRNIEMMQLNSRPQDSVPIFSVQGRHRGFEEVLNSPEPHEYFREQSYCYPIKDEEQGLFDRFYNEKLTGPGLGLLPTAKCSSFCNMICFFYFIIFGLVFLGIANNIKELVVRYDDTCEGKDFCVINITLTTDFYAPVFLYYQLDEFYSNHKFYVDSIQPMQMYGSDLTEQDQHQYCLDAEFASDMPHGSQYVLHSGSGFVMDYSKPANPCGVAAKYFFNDSFVMTSPARNQSVYLNQSQITFFVENEYKFKKHDSFSFRQWLDTDNEHVMNWFGVQTLPQMRKLWAHIDLNLLKGQYQMIIYNNYPVDIFKGTKSFVLSTVSDFGTKNLSFVYEVCITLGGLYLLGSLYIFVRNARRVRTKKNKVKPQEEEPEKLDNSEMKPMADDQSHIRSNEKSNATSAKLHLKEE